MTSPIDESDPVRRVRDYHDGTKHHYDRFARSVGYLDWASQPRPFRSFAGAPSMPLYPAPGAPPLGDAPSGPYAGLYRGESNHAGCRSLPVTLPAIGYFLRHALGLSAWKAFRESRWSLRVNPSSGNLHPTEGYVILGGHVWHYAPEVHALEDRCRFDPAWPAGVTAAAGSSGFVVVLTSIHWRESWKYGERAFRYCQHDIGHAIAALRLSASLCGWTAAVLDTWTVEELAAVTGLDRDDDFVDAEREEPACALLVGPARTGPPESDAIAAGPLIDAIRRGQWAGRASQLSEDHVLWTFIDDVAAATREPLRGRFRRARIPAPGGPRPSTADADIDAATVILQRRSAVALDGLSPMPRDQFLDLLARVMPADSAPWDALWWRPRVHLLLFVHRVTGIDPGLYLLPRTDAGETVLRRAVTRDFAWQRADDRLPLLLLAPGDCRRLAQRVSCDQGIAADGAFSLGMLAEFDDALESHGAPFYRRLFWECGVVGQVLYLEAEAAGQRGTGIGCFFDDAVHDVLGLQGHIIQSLYHFTIGMPVEDRRLTTEPGYGWAR